MSDKVTTAAEVWLEDEKVLLKSQWGWNPGEWGFLGFSSEVRRNTIAEAMAVPSIGLVYVTKNPKEGQKDNAGKICGFYILSDQQVRRADFCEPYQQDQSDGNEHRWLHGLRPFSAFSFFQEDRPVAAELFTEFNDRNVWRSIGRHARWISPEHSAIARLRMLRVKEETLFKPWDGRLPATTLPRPCLPWTKAGPQQMNGYWVEPQDPSLLRHLYILRLVGDERHFLKHRPEGRWIVKIGLSHDPEKRLAALQSHLPRGKFSWSRVYPESLDNNSERFGFEAARAGEGAMKKYLGRDSENWLGGEFYAATEAQVLEAWHIGSEQARAFSGSSVNG